MTKTPTGANGLAEGLKMGLSILAVLVVLMGIIFTVLNSRIESALGANKTTAGDLANNRSKDDKEHQQLFDEDRYLNEKVSASDAKISWLVEDRGGNPIVIGQRAIEAERARQAAKKKSIN